IPIMHRECSATRSRYIAASILSCISLSQLDHWVTTCITYDRTHPEKTAHRLSLRIHLWIDGREPTCAASRRWLRRNIVSTASKIERDVSLGLAAADQQIAIGRRLDWVRLVDDGAGSQSRLAVVTNSGAARPSHRHIARLGEFEQAVECGTPLDSEIA